MTREAFAIVLLAALRVDYSFLYCAACRGGAACRRGGGPRIGPSCPVVGWRNSRVQACRATAVDDRLFNGRLGVGELPRIDELAAVHVVGDDRVLDVRQVHADLVRPAGLRGAASAARNPETPPSLRRTSPLLCRSPDEWRTFRGSRMNSERGVDPVGPQFGRAVHDGHVGLVDLAAARTAWRFSTGRLRAW